jgi:hypothetical protein
MLYENYVLTKQLNLDLIKLKSSCQLMHDLIEKNFISKKESLASTKIFNRYNLLLYPYPEFSNLFKEIKTMFRESSLEDGDYYIQCWLNLYNKGDFIDWHNHWDQSFNSWHGFFCVDCEPSKTSYQIPNLDKIVDIKSKNNLLVMSKSDGDYHRTWPWIKDSPRITIAFDIVPSGKIDPEKWLNHWIPI